MADNRGSRAIDSNASFEDREEASIEASRKKRKKRKAKAQEKNSFTSKLKSKLGFDEVSKKGDKQMFVTESLPYYFSPSFIAHNGKYSAILELYVRPGSNREMTYTDVIDMIPVESLEGVTMNLIVDDASIKGDEKKRLIHKNAKDGKKTLQNIERTGTEEDRENKSTQQSRESDMIDYDEYELIMDRADPVIVFRIQLQVIGPDKETVEEQIEMLNTLLDQKHEGARWDSLGGEQYQRFTHLFRPLQKTRFAMTSTATNYGRLNFSVNSGLNDANGLPVGRDALSLAGSTAFFDMDGTLHRQGIIAIPRQSYMGRYAFEDESKHPSSASIMAQFAANHAVMEGARAHHLVLNDFDYLERNRYYRDYQCEGAFEKFDVSKVTINPLEGFGKKDRSDVIQVYARLTTKIVNTFQILNDLQLTDQQRGIILNSVNSFYLDRKLWLENADAYPGRTRITGITSKDQYPTLGDFIQTFTTSSTAAIAAGRENMADTIDTLQSLLEQSLVAYRGVIGRPTSIKKSEAAQVYYEFKNIESTNVRQVQLLNLLEYVIWTAAEGDVIVIHGVDHLWRASLGFIVDAVKAAQEKGIRFIFSYDLILNDPSRSIPRADFTHMKGSYYKDLDTEVDWSVIGRCLPDEVAEFEKALAIQLSDTIRDHMTVPAECQALVHRSEGDVNSFVHLSVVV